MNVILILIVIRIGLNSDGPQSAVGRDAGIETFDASIAGKVVAF